jgi:hypothetical protein
MCQILLDHMASLKKEPPIPPGTPDPYDPSREKKPESEMIQIPID